MRLSTLAAMLALIVNAAPARAQEFPADDAWDPLRCGDGDMNDAYRDEAGAIDERDIVGTDDEPAGFRAADAEFLYLRMRLDGDPAPGGNVTSFSWGFELDVDDDRTTYELLILADGIAGNAGDVTLATNTVVTSANDPTDPADDPPVATYEWATNARTVVAQGSLFGANDDFFLDVAVPWVDLEPVGLADGDDFFTWAASSSSEQALNADFACHNGATGDPELDDFDDPGGVDTDGDGFTDDDEGDAGTDPNDPGDFPGGGRLEGGGGCAAGGDPAGAAAALLLLLLLSGRGPACRCRRAPRASPSRAG